MEYVVGRKIPQTTVAPDPAQNGANEGQKAAPEANTESGEANKDDLPF
jgi:hypothetical protein